MQNTAIDAFLETYPKVKTLVGIVSPSLSMKEAGNQFDIEKMRGAFKMSEMAKEELKSRINGLSDEEKILVINEMPFDLIFEVFVTKIDQLIETEKNIRALVETMNKTRH